MAIKEFSPVDGEPLEEFKERARKALGYMRYWATRIETIESKIRLIRDNAQGGRLEKKIPDAKYILQDKAEIGKCLLSLERTYIKYGWSLPNPRWCRPKWLLERG